MMTPGNTPEPYATSPPVDQREREHSARRASVDRRWWIKLVLPPVLFLAAGVALMAGLGVAQKLGWISSGVATQHVATTQKDDVRYICPMMCTPPQSEPGRCPVCAMELVPAAAESGDADALSIHVDPVARRVAHIQTVTVKAAPLTRTIRTIGELSYDEGTLKTIAAYVDGRLDRLYADFTGVVVAKGDHLALLYSPQLYSSQVELLLAKRTRERVRSSTILSTMHSGRDVYDSARLRLIEFGMTGEQIDQLEQAGQANSRLFLCAPISGTVIEKLAVEGQYVKTGQPIYRLADLSTVWLMLDLFPEDAAAMRYGQKVEADIQSLPGHKFTGRIAFIDPTVDPKTRTVGVRVVMPNADGLLRVGDYASATIEVALSRPGVVRSQVYDPELANKWISPRHPHVIKSSAGKCPICNIDLVPAAQFGFASEPVESDHVLRVPRNAVLMAGKSSVVYVETEPGRFEIRPVVLGPSCGNEIAVLDGIKEGEIVACSGNFLIDSQMQLAGHPSLIDPVKLEMQSASPAPPSAEIQAALAGLSETDRTLAEAQRVCPVTMMPLGSMGKPIKVDVNGTPVFICCEGCRGKLLGDPETYLATLENKDRGPEAIQAEPTDPAPPIGAMSIEPVVMEPVATEPIAASGELTPTAASAQDDDPIAAALATLPDADRELARRQRICPVTKMPLGSMGTPVKVDVRGRPVFICCEGCRARLLTDPVKYLARQGLEPVRATARLPKPDSNATSVRNQARQATLPQEVRR